MACSFKRLGNPKMWQCRIIFLRVMNSYVTGQNLVSMAA